MPLHRSLKAVLSFCLSLLVLQTPTTATAGQFPIAKPGCPDRCGNVSVPCPFGLKEGCYLNSSSKGFFLNCSHNETLFFSPNSAMYGFDQFRVREIDMVGDLYVDRDDITAIINWAVGNESCSEAISKGSYACKAKHSNCYDAQNRNPTGYRCLCKYGYEGNAYFEDGCPAYADFIFQLKRLISYLLKSYADFIFYLVDGYDNLWLYNLLIGINIIVACRMLLGILICILYLLGKGIRKKLLKKRKEKLFRQNGGHLLQDSLPIFQGATNPIRMFTAEEIEMSTNKFDDKNIIGRGGFGIVYKGYLPEVGALAIKKSKMLDQTEIKQFINEVVLLSKIHHKNVVTFLGCCLEMDVPLLVYEFVSNGTLKSHLHGEQRQQIMPWTTRLKVAAETSGVLAYLQNNHRPPIIHRDVKPENILLDENLNTKVSDFGLSRLVSQNESHMHTKVQGTFGYLDPEYFRTSELTEKSDVYSLGVVLVELITRKKLLTAEYNILVETFGSSMRNNTVYEIIDQDIVNEENVGGIMEVAKVANMCLRDKGEERPTMDEVAVHLKNLWAEVEHKQHATNSYNLEENEGLISRGHLDTHVARPTSTQSLMSSWYLSGGR